MCKEIKEILSEQIINKGDTSVGINTFFAREIEVIKYIKKGLSSKEIAVSFCFSVKTIEVHR